MKRFLRRLGLILLIVIGVVLLLAVIVVSAFEQPLGRRIIAEVNKQLTTELHVGGFDLSVIRTFPNVSVNLRQVVLEDTEGAPLLEAQQMAFRFGLFSLLSNNIRVHSVHISNGALQIFIDRGGNPNYDIFAETEAPVSEEAGPTISLDNAQLENIQLGYQDLSTSQNVSALVQEATFAGRFDAEQYTLHSEAEARIDYVDLEDARYLAGQPLSYEASVQIDNNENLYTLRDVEVTLGRLPLAAAGTIENRPQTTNFNLEISSPDGSVEALLSLLPEQYRHNPGDLQSSGNFTLDGMVRGEYGPQQSPQIQADIVFTDGRITSPNMDGDIRDVDFEASFTNGSEHSRAGSVFELRRLTGYFQQELYEMRMRVENFENPLIDFAANGVMPVGVLRGFLPAQHIEGGSGSIAISELRLRGRYDDMIRPGRIDRVEAAGALVFNAIQLQLKNEQVRLDSGQVRLDGNALLFEGLHFAAPGTDMVFQGSARNLLPVLFADSLNTQQAELDFQANLRAEQLDIDQLLALFDPTTEEQEEAAATGQTDSLETAQVQQRQEITRFLRGTFDAAITEFNYDKIQGSDFQGKLEFINNELDIEGRTRAMGGEFIVDGRMYLQDQPYLKTRLICNDVDIHEFFTQAENFGQEVLVAENISGRLDARMVITAYFDEQGNFLRDKLEVIAGVGITDGELQDFKLLESFSTFVNIRDLRNIQFTDLQNFLEVRNGRIYLPVMFIQSNAVNLTVSGEHTFDQDIAYYLKVNAGQVLANRFRRHDSSLAPKPARKDGFFNLYYAITGNIDDYEVKTARRRVKEDFELSELRRREVQQALEREFGIPIELIEEPVEWRDIPEYQEDPNDDSPEYLDFEVRGGGKTKKSEE